jgi:hypothetical protein
VAPRISVALHPAIFFEMPAIFFFRDPTSPRL